MSNVSSLFNVSSPANMSQDIDEDNSFDSVRVNGTHLLFNVTSQHSVIAIRLVDNSGAPVDITTVGAGVQINLTGQNVTSLQDGDELPIVFATLNVQGTTTTDMTLDSGVVFNITDTEYTKAMLHIPELRGGQSSFFKYNISSNLVAPPLDLNTNYTQTFNRKVLSGHTFIVNDSVTNQLGVGLPVSDINISIFAKSIPWAGQTYNFTLVNLSTDASTDYGNVTAIDNQSWYWHVNGGTLGNGATSSISYGVQAPWNVPTSGIYLAIEQRLAYTVPLAASNLTVNKVLLRANVNFTVSKEIVSPADNELNRTVTWRSVPKVGTPLNISFDLTKVTLWEIGRAHV